MSYLAAHLRSNVSSRKIKHEQKQTLGDKRMKDMMRKTRPVVSGSAQVKLLKLDIIEIEMKINRKPDGRI